MPYHDGFCDECGDEATLITAMYCLCDSCAGCGYENEVDLSPVEGESRE